MFLKKIFQINYLKTLYCFHAGNHFNNILYIDKPSALQRMTEINLIKYQVIK